MNDDRHDGSLLIGLHKVAEQNGDGLVPELYALMSVRAELAAPDMSNVVALPKSAKVSSVDISSGVGAQVLAFRR